MSNGITRRVAGLALALALLGTAAQAQLQAGNLYGTAQDGQQAALPGVTITLSGGGAPQVQVSNAQGQFRFLALAPGSYALRAELEGFSTVDYPNVVINVGRNTQIELSLSAAVEDVITVTAESPLLDERRISTGATVSSAELEKIPTARDPWAILQSTPGVLTDRINVGGNESGQQSLFVGPGASCDQAVWSVDGVVITDMAAVGSSPAYYDFDSFEEMQITTGGSDTTMSSPGLALNMVTKRGTNEWRGSARLLETDQDRQADTSLSSSELATAGPWRSGSGATTPQASFKAGNRIVNIKDYGAEVGGPIVKNRLWIWGSYGRQEVDLLTVADVSDFTDLETKNAKINAQLAAANTATGSFFDSDKVKIGRNAGPARPQETTWNQGKFGPAPTSYKVEDTHVFSSSLYLTGMYSKVNGGFELAPQGGLALTPTQGPDGVFHNSFQLIQILRPQEQVKLDSSTFFNTGRLSHELKFGAGYRQVEVSTLSRWPGTGLVLDGPTNFGLPAGVNFLAAARDSGLHVRQEYTGAFVQDTLTTGSLTLNVGLRYDKQEGTNLAATARANPGPGAAAAVLPSVSQGELDAGFDWTDVTPRLGVTYALGAERKTLVRGSYSRFADQLGTGPVAFTNPLGLNGYAYFLTAQPVGGGNDGTISNAEILGPPVGFSANVNPITHGLLTSSSVSPSFSAPQTDELLASVEHALRPEFVVGLNLTYRQLSNLSDTDLLVFDGSTAACEAAGDSLQCPAFAASNLGSLGRRASRADFVPVTFSQPLPDGSVRTITWYRLREGVSTRGGQHLYSGDSEQEYQGASLVFNKRLANRWMLRGNFTASSWEWSKVAGREDPSLLLGGGGEEGDPFLQGSGTGSGSKGGVYINSNWSYSVNGLYQIAPERPWGFDVAANVTGRQGYAIPYFRRRGGELARENFATSNLQVTDRPDELRLDDIHTLDLRVEKELGFSDFGLTLGVDVFNVFNESYVLQRNHRLGQTTSDNVREILSPRILRLGARLSFR